MPLSRVLPEGLMANVAPIPQHVSLPVRKATSAPGQLGRPLADVARSSPLTGSERGAGKENFPRSRSQRTAHSRPGAHDLNQKTGRKKAEMTEAETEFHAALATARHALERFNAEPLVPAKRGGPRLSPWFRSCVQASEVAAAGTVSSPAKDTSRRLTRSSTGFWGSQRGRARVAACDMQPVS
jgi:hypothetical protein